jgi:uncharacterized GH25 family protein
MTIKTALFTLFVVASGGTVVAHDFWIEPTTFFTSAGSVVPLRLRVGEDLLGDPVPRDPAAIDQFILADGATRRPIVGGDGADPAGLLKVESSGLLVLGYRSRPNAVVLPAEKFNQYLSEEGLEAVAAARAARNQSAADGRELFSRAAKSLVLSGPAARSQRDRALGFRLELVAEENPYAVGTTERLPVRLLYEDQPLPGALVVAINKADPAAKLSARTDAQGRVRFGLVKHGMWLIKAVHMVPAPAGSGADWESVWASLTFELRQPAAASPR